MKYFLTILLAATSSTGCKTREDSSDVRSGPARAVSSCALEDNWAGRMGLRLKDATEQDGAVIECVVIGKGLHHIGLAVGDKITSLGRGTKVNSALGFEQTATALATAKKDRIRKWQFSVLRNSAQLEIAPREKYPGCGIFTFDDCGPLDQLGKD